VFPIVVQSAQKRAKNAHFATIFDHFQIKCPVGRGRFFKNCPVGPRQFTTPHARRPNRLAAGDDLLEIVVVAAV
jgi:hypothetical protein